MAKPFNKIKDTRVLGIDSQLTFGRHIGYTVNEVLKDRPQYICWLIDNTQIKFHQSVHDIVDSIFPPDYTWKVPKDISYWQDQQHWDDDIPF